MWLYPFILILSRATQKGLYEGGLWWEGDLVPIRRKLLKRKERLPWSSRGCWAERSERPAPEAILLNGSHLCLPETGGWRKASRWQLEGKGGRDREGGSPTETCPSILYFYHLLIWMNFTWKIWQLVKNSDLLAHHSDLVIYKFNQGHFYLLTKEPTALV